MPDINGVLSPEEKEKATKWLNEKMIRRECPACGSKNWIIAEHMVSPTVVNAAAIGLQTPYPQVMVISECGYSYFFNAMVMGLFQGDA